MADGSSFTGPLPVKPNAFPYIIYGKASENNANFLRDRGYNILLLNFRNPQKGNSWNPLSLPYKLYKSGNKDLAIDEINNIC